MRLPVYLPLHLRLALFFTLVTGLALWFFGSSVYTQAAQHQYQDLDDALSSRANSVRLGKLLLCNSTPSTASPVILPSVDGLGSGGVAIEVLDTRLNLLAATTDYSNNPLQTGVSGLSLSPVPFDARAIRRLLQRESSQPNTIDNGLYSTVTIDHQPTRVYTLINSCGDSMHVIQTARSEQSIEQSLNNLRLVLVQGAILVMAFALIGVWLISWLLLATVRRMTTTAQNISASRDFSKRVHYKALLGRDEFAILATTFNQMLANLEETYRRQQRFIADASHELRAPITSIRCNLDLLAKAPDLPPAEAQAALADARAESERMGRLVSDLLLLAHADGTGQTDTSDDYGDKKVKRPFQDVDLDSLLLDVFRQYRSLEVHEHGERQAQGPRLLLQHITPARVHGDADQLKQALVALVDNALKYTPREGYIALSLALVGGRAVVKVSDTGIGMSPEDLPHVFERFYRADPARTRDRGGSGLGLAIVQSIMQEHQGSIEVESTPGKGSTFTLSIPVVEEKAAGL